MKKTMKIIGKIVMGYAILDTICLAVIGTGEVLEEACKHPELDNSENNCNVWRRSINKIKKSIFE